MDNYNIDKTIHIEGNSKDLTALEKYIVKKEQIDELPPERHIPFFGNK